MTGALVAARTGRELNAQEAMLTDVVVVGSGAAGLAAAVSAATAGASVIVLEKSTTLGGTTAKSGGVFWVPDNHLMRQAGLADDRELALRYMARVSAPDRYSADAPRLGLTPWEHLTITAYLDRSPLVLAELEDLHALRATVEAGQHFPDYRSDLPEQGGIRGRALTALKTDGTPGSGSDIVEQLATAAERLGVQILTETAFTDLAVHAGAVGGVLALREGREVLVSAARGVVLASGGFTHNAQRRAVHLPARTWGGCAAGGNTGDILPPLEALGVPLHNMDCAWWDQVAIEHTLAGSTETRAGVWVAPGDSSLIVDLTGRRVVDEKADYNTRAKVHHGPGAPEVLVLLLDERSRQLFCGEAFAYPIATEDAEPGDHLMSAGSWAELVQALDERLRQRGDSLGGAVLAQDFLANLVKTVDRFNEYALAGVDPDFRRGSSEIGRFFTGAPRPGGGPNPTMAPLSEGPYHAVLIGLGTLDTKGGPRTDQVGRVLGADDAPVRGLYAAGNAAASPSAQGYWAAGATIGPALVFGFEAGRDAALRGDPPARSGIQPTSTTAQIGTMK
jgi:3-oxosteroid 1-dehydrogenase